MRRYLLIFCLLFISLISCDVRKMKGIELGKFELLDISADYDDIKLLKAYNAGISDGESEIRANVYLIKVLSVEEELFVIEPCREFSQLAERDFHELEKRDLMLVSVTPPDHSYIYVPESADIPEGSKVIWGSLKLLSY